MRRCCTLTIAVLVALFLHASALKILVYQTAFGTSHVQFSGALVDVLTDRGHTVDKLLQVYNTNTLSNGTTRARRVYRINSRMPSPWLQMGHITNPLQPLNADEWVAQFRETREIFCDELLGRSDLLEELKSEKYDIGLTSIADGCSHGLFHLLGIPVTSGYVAFGWSDDVALALGIPTPPSYLPGVFDGYVGTDKLTLTQRFHNLFNHYDRLQGVANAFEEEQSIFDRRFKEFPRLTELFTRMSYVFMNNNELLDMPRPQSSKIKYIGGIAMKPTKAVSAEIQRLCNLLPDNLYHRVMRDVDLNGYHLPKGTMVVPQISCVLSDEKTFPEPYRFKPERFLDANGQLLKVEELVPFSVGKRICLGESLARMELFLLVANIFHQFKVRPVDPLNPPSSKKIPGFAVRLNPYKVRLSLRHSPSDALHGGA